MTPDFLSKLRRVRQLAPGRWTACCPAHQDRSPSLSITIGERGRLLVHCHAGCSYQSIFAAIDAPMTLGPAHAPAAAPATIPPAELELTWRRLASNVDPARLARFAGSLGLCASSLGGVGWDVDRRCWAFPMRDAAGRVLGVRYRTEQGRKFSLTGGREGLFLCDPAGAFLFLPEGPTSRAALAEMGLWAVGRPSCMGGRSHAADYVARHRPARVVVVGDNDKPAPNGQRPGLHGSRTLAAELGQVHGDVRVMLPPLGFKDCRDWFIGGARRGHVLEAARRAPVTSRREAVA